MSHQPAIVAAPPRFGRFLVLGLVPGADGRSVVERLQQHRAHDDDVIGLGAPVLGAGATLADLGPFPALAGRGVAFPSTQGAVWASFGGEDPGELLHRARAFVASLGDLVRVDEEVTAFRYAEGRDLTGYEDGTENPKGERALATALVSGRGAGLDGGSFVAAQRWIHDLARFERMPAAERDAVVGRRRSDNEEIADAPPSAHVKRTAQESFDPPAFMVRRSMPFGDAREHGLYFVAYGASHDAFARALARMAGLDDGILDGMLRFSRAVSGGYYFCPPLAGGRLDLRAFGG